MHTPPRIALITYGTRGDVEPFIALGDGLQRAGYAVSLLAPAGYAPLAGAYQVGFKPLPGDPDELALSFSDRAGLSGVRMMASMVEHVMPIAANAFRTMELETRDADLIVHSFLITVGGSTLAQRLGIPEVSAQLFPMFLPTSDFPAIGMPDLPLGGLYRIGTHWFSSMVFRLMGGILYRKIRARALDLPHLGMWPFDPKRTPRTPILYAYSPSVLPQPQNWPPYAHTTGYWRLPLHENWFPSAALQAFMEKGHPPVYFGVGSMLSRRMQDFAQMAIEAARKTGQRLVLNVPAKTLEPPVGGEDIFLAENIPHDWLYPQTSFILHHGGAGTTGAAVRAGIPNSAIAFTGDQGFWAKRIYSLGLGPAAPNARKLTSETLAQVIENGLREPGFRNRAHALGEKVRGEDGVGVAVRIIQEALGC